MPAQSLPSQTIQRDYRSKNRHLAAGFENWLRVRNYSPSTCDARLRSVAKWLDFLGPDDLAAVTHSRIRLFMAQADKAHTQRARLDALRAFYRFLLLAGVVHFSPAQFIKPRRQPPPKLPRVLSESEIKRLIRAASTPRERAILEIFYATGCRLSEVKGLRVCDVDLKRREIRVLGKGNRERIALFGESAARALKTYLSGRRTGALFQNREGRFLSRESLAKIIRDAGKRAGLRVHPHLLRHSFATHLLRRGADIRAVQEFLGHACIRNTQIYSHLAVNDLRAIHEKCHPHGKGESNAKETRTQSRC